MALAEAAGIAAAKTLISVIDSGSITTNGLVFTID
jgi:hypothetical protein